MNHQELQIINPLLKLHGPIQTLTKYSKFLTLIITYKIEINLLPLHAKISVEFHNSNKIVIVEVLQIKDKFFRKTVKSEKICFQQETVNIQDIV